MKFETDDNGQKIICDIVTTFRDNNNNINYIIYTDGTYDENGELEIYASRYILDNGKYILNDIESEYEWNLIDNMLDVKKKEYE